MIVPATNHQAVARRSHLTGSRPGPNARNRRSAGELAAVSGGAPVGIRTPNLLIRNLGALVQPGAGVTDHASSEAVRQLLRATQCSAVLSVAAHVRTGAHDCLRFRYSPAATRRGRSGPPDVVKRLWVRTPAMRSARLVALARVGVELRRGRRRCRCRIPPVPVMGRVSLPQDIARRGTGSQHVARA
jgi:hypothetical protein